MATDSVVVGGREEGEMLKDLEQDFRSMDPDAGKLDSNEVLDALARDERGDAAIFEAIHRGRFCFDHKLGLWFANSGHTWVEDDVDEVIARVDDVVEAYEQEAQRQNWLQRKAAKEQDGVAEKKHANTEKALISRIRNLQKAHRRQNVLKLARSGKDSLALTQEWDRNPWLIGVKNGVIDLRTREHREGSPGDYIRRSIPTEWTGIDTPAPTWEKALHDIFADRQELVDSVQRLFGYGLTGQVTNHKLPILYGRGRNGKGTIFETLHHVLGPLAGPVEAEMLLAQAYSRRSGTPTPDIMALKNQRIVWASETGDGRRLNADRVKWLTGGDTLTGRELYSKPVTFRPTHTLFLLTNYRPHAPANDYALWERIYLIPFDVSFVDRPEKEHERKADPDLPDKLRAEAPGILAWLVRGVLEYQRRGLDPPEIVRAATQEYRDDEDLVGHFIKERCILHQGAKTQSSKLYEAYRKWCEVSGHRPVSHTRFGKDMKERFDSAKDGNKYFLGIGLLEEGSR